LLGTVSDVANGMSVLKGIKLAKDAVQKNNYAIDEFGNVEAIRKSEIWKKIPRIYQIISIQLYFPKLKSHKINV